MSGTDAYDLVLGQMFYSAQKATEGIFYDWNSMPYVDLTKPWYTKSIQDSSIGNKMYMIESDLSISYTQQTWMIQQPKPGARQIALRRILMGLPLLALMHALHIIGLTSKKYM
jgi:hypothetical protein